MKKEKLQTFLLCALIIFIVFSLIMGTIFIITYFPAMREGLTANTGQYVPTWEEIKKGWSCTWIISLIVCPLMATPILCMPIDKIKE
jgi:hypothetical protein